LNYFERKSAIAIIASTPATGKTANLNRFGANRAA
jgi:hypothetical protein